MLALNLFEPCLRVQLLQTLQAHCGTASHNIWSSADGICMQHVSTNCYQPRMIAEAAKLTNTLKPSDQFVNKIVDSPKTAGGF